MSATCVETYYFQSLTNLRTVKKIFSRAALKHGFSLIFKDTEYKVHSFKPCENVLYFFLSKY